jgi:hypothetical protein
MDWTVAVIVTTILEAFTCQIDNLVLALTGATVVMIQSRWAASYNQMDNLVLRLITVVIAVSVINIVLSNHDSNKHKDFTCKDMFISNVPRVSTDESEVSTDLRLRPRGIMLHGETSRTVAARELGSKHRSHQNVSIHLSKGTGENLASTQNFNPDRVAKVNGQKG